MQARTGFSLIELMISVVILGLILGSQIVLLGSANRFSNVALNELLAIQYASELGGQIQKLGPHLKDLRLKTGQSIKTICSNQNFHAGLNGSGQPEGSPFILRLPFSDLKNSDISLFLSPLEPGFVSRTLTFDELDSADPNLQVWDQTAGFFWRATICLGWKTSREEIKPRFASFSFIIREDSL